MATAKLSQAEPSNVMSKGKQYRYFKNYVKKKERRRRKKKVGTRTGRWAKAQFGQLIILEKHKYCSMKVVT